MPSLPQIYQFVFTPDSQQKRVQIQFWLFLSLFLAAVPGLRALWSAFRIGAEYVAQYDAKDHLFWMHRFFQPESFPHDLSADYFKSIAPSPLSHWILPANASAFS